MSLNSLYKRICIREGLSYTDKLYALHKGIVKPVGDGELAGNNYSGEEGFPPDYNYDKGEYGRAVGMTPINANDQKNGLGE